MDTAPRAYPEPPEPKAIVASEVVQEYVVTGVLGREYADHITRAQPDLLASLGLTEGELAAACNDARSLDEAVAAGWISAAEQRFIEARATREDLLALGHAPAAIDALLVEQQACASSN